VGVATCRTAEFRTMIPAAASFCLSGGWAEAEGQGKKEQTKNSSNENERKTYFYLSVLL
jgi:hypothetical protein